MGDFKKRLANGEKMTGTMLTIFDNPEIVRILKNNGFDYFFFDTEHGYANYDRLYPMFAYARFAGITGFLRIPEINKTEVLRAVEMGVDGIYAPIVETPAQARELVEHAKYYPLGSRGVNFARPHTGYAKVNGTEYVKKANDELMLICMIESMKGVENADEILAVEGIDGLMIGHNDLTQSMGILGQITHPDFIAATNQVIQACHAHHKFAGASADNMEQMQRWMEKGVHLNQWTSDVGIFASAIKENLAKIEPFKKA